MASEQAMGPKAIPAQLSALALYNPSLASSEHTFDQQVVFWYSRAERNRRKESRDVSNSDLAKQLQEEENVRLKLVGLAQGMVNFAQNFAHGQPADHVETEKSRIVIKELERDWWVFAVVDLTQIIHTTAAKGKAGDAQPTTTIEYSARELSPPGLLITQLVQAYRLFLLHNGRSLSDLFARQSRLRFCGLLERYWSRFVQNWDVRLHGNPAIESFDGLKLAAGGELGIGVGEEEWGSGEREVLEDFAGRTDGLVDLVVGRYGEPAPKSVGKADKNSMEENLEPWMGGGINAQAADGIVFSGVGALSRRSLRDVSNWMRDIYSYAGHAYGVRDNPSSDRRKRKRKHPTRMSNSETDPAKIPHPPDDTNLQSPRSPSHPGIPPPIVSPRDQGLKSATYAPADKRGSLAQMKSPGLNTEPWTTYLTLGYGTVWGPPSAHPNSARAFHSTSAPTTATLDNEDVVSRMHLMHLDPEPDTDRAEERLKFQISQENSGHFIIGLKGDVTDELADDETSAEDRILLRTLYVEVKPTKARQLSAYSLLVGDSDIGSEVATPVEQPRLSPLKSPTGGDAPDKMTRLRVVVYVHRPFIYVFLFQPRTESLSMSGFYRNLYTYLAPLHKPLNASTSPSKVSARISAAGLAHYPLRSDYEPANAAGQPDKAAAEKQPIFDLVFDPVSLSIHASVPNIPLPSTIVTEGQPARQNEAELYPVGWARAEALNVHSSILEIVRSSRTPSAQDEVERSVKTGRGWWIVWMKLGATDDTAEAKGADDAAAQTDAVSSTRAVLSPSSIKAVADATERDDYFPDVTAGDETTPRASQVVKQALLIRRARDASSTMANPKPKANRATSSLWTFGLGGGGAFGSGGGKDAASGWGPARLAEGVGVDARSYVESLVGLGR